MKFSKPDFQLLSLNYSVRQKINDSSAGTLLHVAAGEGHVLTSHILIQVCWHHPFVYPFPSTNQLGLIQRNNLLQDKKRRTLRLCTSKLQKARLFFDCDNDTDEWRKQFFYVFKHSNLLRRPTSTVKLNNSIAIRCLST